MKIMEQCSILRQTEISPGIFDLLLEAPQIADRAVPGQFVNVCTGNPAKLLPRPVSLCEIDRSAGQLRLVYRVSGAGTGTELLAGIKEGAVLKVLGPLGNGFPLEEAGNQVFLIGGGIGIPPMLETAKQLAAAGRTPQIVLGYRDDCFLADAFTPYGTVHLATEDGSTGIRGTVLDVLLQKQLKPDLIFSCGPRPMLRALKAYAEANGIPCWVSMEERMACGVGACLACVCETAGIDEHSHVRNARVCKDGPVFRSTEVVL